MSTDRAGLTDEAIPELNPAEVEDVQSPNSLTRPARDADRTEWVAYAVNLGADRGLLDGGTQYWDPTLNDGDGGYVTAPEMPQDDVMDLAYRLEPPAVDPG